MPVDRFVERETEDDTDIRGVAEEEFERSTVIEGCSGDAIADEACVLKGEEPAVIGCTRAVEKPVNVMLESLVTTFRRVLVLVVCL
jgi:hypothetical protein